MNTRTQRILLRLLYSLVLTSCLALLLGCQGVSTSSTSPQKAGTTEKSVLSVSQSSLSFGTVTLGDSSSRSEILTNTGTKSITITQCSTTGAAFTVKGCSTPVTLAAGQNETLAVAFLPEAAGEFTGNLIVGSDASNPTLDIELSGSSLLPGALTAVQNSINFGRTTVGKSSSVSETIKNSGGSALTITHFSFSSAAFSTSDLSLPLSLNAGQDKTFTVEFRPQSTDSFSGKLTLQFNGTNSLLEIPLSGAGVSAGALTAAQGDLSFGSIVLGNSSSIAETITNTGGSPVAISRCAITGAGFSLSGISTPVILEAGQARTFGVSFAPQSAGASSGKISIESDASSSPLYVLLSGSGTTAPELSVNPSTIEFGDVIVGRSGEAFGTLSATGSDVTVSALTINNSAFSIAGLSLPLTIPMDQSVAFTILFTPQIIGSANAQLTVTSKATTSVVNATLTGAGVPAPSIPKIRLLWEPSTAPKINGYNIYRSTYSGSCGSFSKLNSMLNENTSYVDSTVVPGYSYCYAVTAVDTDNRESDYSNLISDLQIPAP